MHSVTIEVAQLDLASLVDEAASGEDVVIERDGRPVARLVAMAPVDAQKPRILGLLAGQFTIPDDFDAPLPDDILDLFEGRG